jgi:hypothetical protein
MFPHECTIVARTAGTADAYGETAWTWPTAGTTTDCEFWDAKGEEAIRPVSGEAERTVRMVKIPPTVTIARDTYRIVSTWPGYAGTYRVKAIATAPGLYGTVHHYEVELEEVAA